jgi:hypothetical protein
MGTRALNDGEKDFIREEIQEAVKAGFTEEEIKKVRVTLAELLGCSLPQVGSVGAWKEKPGQGKKVLEPTISLSNSLPEEDSGKETKEVEQVNPVFPNLAAETSDNKSKSNGEDYETVSYDNEQKERWRQKWVEFINVNFPRELRSKTKVLCLPAKDCLEIPHYLALGFRPENIIGLIKGENAEAVNEFQQNAMHFGINPCVGDLEDYLRNSDRRYGVVVLDFHCCFSQKHSRILKSLLLEPDAILITNFAARREKSEIQRLFDIGHYKRVKGKVGIDPSLNFEEGFFEDLEEESLRQEIFKFKVDRSREAGITDFFDKVGMSRKENHLFDEKERAHFVSVFQSFSGSSDVNQLIDGKKMYDKSDKRHWLELTAINTIAAEASIAMEKLFRVCPCDNPTAAAHACHILIEAAAIGRPFFLNSEQWHYQSESGTSGTTFISNFLKVNTPIGIYRSMRPTIDFLLHAGGYNLPVDKENKGKGMAWTEHKGGSSCMVGDTPHRLFFKDGDGKVMKLYYNKLANDLGLFYKLITSSEKHNNVLSRGSSLIE